jgi:hypothetical protein
MKIAFAAAVALAAATVAMSPPVSAATPLFATEGAASQACSGDEVVWVDLDNGRYYHKTQSSYAKGNNGGYACLKGAHSQYREAHN